MIGPWVDNFYWGAPEPVFFSGGYNVAVTYYARLAPAFSFELTHYRWRSANIRHGTELRRAPRMMPSKKNKPPLGARAIFQT